MPCPLEQPETVALRELAQGVREIFVKVLSQDLRQRGTKGSCLYASILVCKAVNRFSGGLHARVAGGSPRDGTGLVTPACTLAGHYWVEVCRAGRWPSSEQRDCDWVVDITADQFGGAEVVVAPWPAARGLYRPGPANLWTRRCAAR
jgi:hypothetical protein